MNELNNKLDKEIIPLRKNESAPEVSPGNPDVSLPPPDDDKDIEYGLRLLSIHNFQNKGTDFSSLDENTKKRIIASLVILGIAIFFLLLLWAIASFMPKTKRHASISRHDIIERVC
jgi:hypothetical protein